MSTWFIIFQCVNWTIFVVCCTYIIITKREIRKLNKQILKAEKIEEALSDFEEIGKEMERIISTK